MAQAKVQVLVTLNGAGVWRVVAPLDPANVRHLTEQELTTLSDAIPRLIESIVKERQEPPELQLPPTIRTKKR
jgi:hypothetical protein